MEIISISELNDFEPLYRFNCGNPFLNHFLFGYAYKNNELNIGKTFLLMDNKVVIGYVTICTASVEFNEMPNDYRSSYPRYPVPAVRIARLAVGKRFHGKGYGKLLLTYSFDRILYLSKSIGIKVILVDSKEESKTFYEHFGFRLLKEESSTYYMPIECLESAVSK